jgi:hypothetical protein
MYTHPLGPAGSLFQVAGVVVSIILGIQGKPALISVLAGSILFVIGYVIVKLPQMIRTFRDDGPKILLLFTYLLMFNCILSSIFYAIGMLFS